MRVYVETSVWSLAFAEDAPDYRVDTLAFFQRCRERSVEPVISPVVLDELDRANPPLRDEIRTLVHEIGPSVVSFDDDAARLAAAFLREHAVPASKPEDAKHVAIAFAAELDVLVSWNFRHIVSVRRADRFNAVAILEGFFKPVRVASPAEVFDDDFSAP